MAARTVHLMVIAAATGTPMGVAMELEIPTAIPTETPMGIAMATVMEMRMGIATATLMETAMVAP